MDNKTNDVSKLIEFKLFVDGSVTNQAATLKNKHLRRGGYGIYHPESETKLAIPFTLPDPTNNRCEYMACIKALEWVKEVTKDSGNKTQSIKVFLYTDCQLIIDSMTKWITGWRKRGWKKADGKPVSNQELLQKLDRLISNDFPQTKFVKVKAHVAKKDATDMWLWKGNFVADELANEGRKAIT